MILDIVDVTSKHSLSTLPTLIGFTQDQDLNRKLFKTTADRLNAAQMERPDVDFSRVAGIDEILTSAEDIKLLPTNVFPGTIAVGKGYVWHRRKKDYYFRSDDSEYLFVIYQNDHWIVAGDARGIKYRSDHATLADAVRDGSGVLKERDVKPYDDPLKAWEEREKEEPARPGDLWYLENHGVTVPLNPSRYETHQLSMRVSEKKKRLENTGRSFQTKGISLSAWRTAWEAEPADALQASYLRKNGVPIPPRLTKEVAQKLILEVQRNYSGRASQQQMSTAPKSLDGISD